MSFSIDAGASAQLGDVTLGYGDTIYADNGLNLDNATVTFSGYGSSVFLDVASAGEAPPPVATLTLGSHFTLVADSSGEALGSVGAVGDDTIDNQGTIEVESSGNLTIDPTHFINHGSIEVTTGGSLTIDDQNGSQSVTNAGTISGDDVTVTFGNFGQFTNSGTFDVTQSTINLYGSFSTAQIAVFAGLADTVAIYGTLVNSDATLQPGEFAPLVLTSGGHIMGGTVNDPDGVTQFQSGTLDGVTWEGLLNLQSGTVYIDDGITFAGAAGSGLASVNVGTYSTMYVNATPTFETPTLDNATIAYTGYSGEIYLNVLNDGQSGAPTATLTLGAHLTLIASDDNYGSLTSTGTLGDDTIDNQGTIEVKNSGNLTIDPTNFINHGSIEVTTGGSLSIDDQNGSQSATNAGTISGDDATVTFGNFGQFTNSGTFDVTQSTINLYGSFSTAQIATFAGLADTVAIYGTLVNSDATLQPGEFSPLVLTSGGHIMGGTVNDPDGVTQFQSGTLDGVTWEGLLNLQSGTVYIDDGITFAGAAGSGLGSVNVGTYSTMYVNATPTFETPTLDNATIAYTGYSGQIYLNVLNDGQSGAPTATLTLGAHLTLIANDDNYGNLTSTGTLGDDTIDNQGTIEVESSGNLTIDPTNFINHGSIEVTTGGSLSIDDQNGSQSATNAGTISGDDATVTFGNFGQFTNSGTFDVTQSTINLYGSFSTAQIATFAGLADTVAIYGTLVNSDATLQPGEFSPLVLTSGGHIMGGTVNDPDGVTQFQSGTLDGVTWEDCSTFRAGLSISTTALRSPGRPVPASDR